MAKRTRRPLISYWVCCDCKNCESGNTYIRFSFLDNFQTQPAALKAMTNYRGHSSCFLVKETLEPLAPTPKRKAG